MFFSDLANDNQLKTVSNIGAQHALGQGSATCDSLAPLSGCEKTWNLYSHLIMITVRNKLSTIKLTSAWSRMTMKRCQYFMAGHICWKMKQNGSCVKTAADLCSRIYLLNSLQCVQNGGGGPYLWTRFKRFAKLWYEALMKLRWFTERSHSLTNKTANFLV